MVMIRKFLTSSALAAGCALALVVPAAQAQTVETQILTNAPRINPGDRTDWMAAGNNQASNDRDSTQYERLLRTDPGFRQSRMIKECESIAIAHLRAGCFDSFSISEDQRLLSRQERMTGGGSGMMNSTNAPSYTPNMYGTGAGR